MAVLDIRQRTGWLFVAVAVGHIILISTQVNTRRGVPMLEEFTFGVFAEVQRGATSVIGGVREGWQQYFALQEIRGENSRLRDEVARLRLGLQQERALAQQSRELQKLLGLRGEVNLSATGAAVIAGGASPDFRTITIDKGTGDGLRADMAVLAPEGVVGRILLPTARAAKVQLLIDRNAAAGGLVERTRAQGVVVGTGTDRLRLEYVPATADIKVGDRVVTSGVEGIYPSAGDAGTYPKGFVIGHIESIRRGGATYSDVIVTPAVDYSALETVLVVLQPPSAPPVAEPTAEAAAAPEAR